MRDGIPAPDVFLFILMLLNLGSNMGVVDSFGFNGLSHGRLGFLGEKMGRRWRNRVVSLARGGEFDFR